jgi:glycosyltransferase involved in cell wall biosynthesis
MKSSKSEDGHCLKILHVISDMQVATGGPPVGCAGLTAACAARGHEVAIATTHRPLAAAADGNNSGQFVPTDARVTVDSFPTSGARNYRYSPGLDRWLRREAARFDIVHLHGLWQFPSFAAARACRRARVPYLVSPHGMLDSYSLRQHSFFLKCAYWLLRERRTFAGAAGIHCLNEAEHRRAAWIRPFPKYLLPNGISSRDLHALPPPGRFRAARPELGPHPLILFLGRLHPKKGLDRLIPAWNHFVERSPDARLIIAGSGDPAYTRQLTRLIAQHRLDGRIVLIGQLSGNARWEALVDADLMVLPSRQEGFSNAILEALAAGCPPVITDSCNFDEVAREGCGLILPDDDMVRFAQATAALLADAPRRGAMAAAGKKLVANRFTWDILAAELDQLYRWILDGNKLPTDARPVWKAPSPDTPLPQPGHSP